MYFAVSGGGELRVVGQARPWDASCRGPEPAKGSLNLQGSPHAHAHARIGNLSWVADNGLLPPPSTPVFVTHGSAIPSTSAHLTAPRNHKTLLPQTL